MFFFNRIVIVLSIFLFLGNPISATCGIEFKYPGNTKVLVFAPGYDTPSDTQEEIAIKTDAFFYNAAHFSANFPLDIRKNEAASVELVKSFDDYGTVIIHTHGWFWDSGTGVGPYPGFRTGTVALEYGVLPDNGLIDHSYFNDLLFFRLAVSKRPNTVGEYHFVVLPDYIKKYVSPSMPDTFMYLGYCHSLQNDEMWKAFQQKGAKVAFGWDEEIDRDDNVKFFDELMQRMLPDDVYIEPMTATGAFDDIPEILKKDTYDSNLTANVVPEVSSLEWNNFIYKSLPLIFYLRPTIDGNPLIKGGQRFSFHYTDKDGNPAETSIKSIKGFSGGGDPTLYHFAGSYDLIDWDGISPIQLRMYAERDSQSIAPLPWDDINGFDVHSWSGYSFSPYAVAKYSDVYPETAVYLTQREDFDTHSYLKYSYQVFSDILGYHVDSSWGTGTILVTTTSHALTSLHGSETIEEVHQTGLPYTPFYRRERSLPEQYQQVKYLQKTYSPDNFMTMLVEENEIYNYETLEYEQLPLVFSPSIDFNLLATKIKFPYKSTSGGFYTDQPTACAAEYSYEPNCQFNWNYLEGGPTYTTRYDLSINQGLHFEEMLGIQDAFYVEWYKEWWFPNIINKITDQAYRITDSQLYFLYQPFYFSGPAKNLRVAIHRESSNLALSIHNNMFEFNGNSMLIAVDELFQSNVWKQIVNEERSSFEGNGGEFSGIMTRGSESTVYVYNVHDPIKLTVVPDTPLEFIYKLERMPSQLY